MKIHIGKQMKKILIIILSLLIISFAFLLIKEVKIPKFKEEKVTQYSYNNRAGINYKVNLKPNILFSEASIGQGNIYITEFINNIEATFNYSFTGNEAAELQGDYEIIGEVEGFVVEDEKDKTIWKKRYVLQPKTAFQYNGDNYNVNKTVHIDLAKYNTFAISVIEATKINSQVRLNVFMNANTKADTNYGSIEDILSPKIVIPLNANYFEIIGSLNQEKPGSFETARQVQVPLNKKLVTVYIIALVFLLVGLVFIIFFTVGSIQKDPVKKYIKKILKAYGDRLVALNSDNNNSYKKNNKVNTIEDLVRIADEIGKPIMYNYSEDLKDLSEFYVIDNETMYSWELNDLKMHTGNKNIDNLTEKSNKYC